MAIIQGVPQLNTPMVSQQGVVTQGWYLFFLNLWSRTGGAQNNTNQNGAFSGEIRGFAGATLPPGWIQCDGSAIARATYSVLFAVIGTTWGVGDGSTTFNVPNLLERFPLGAGGPYPLGQHGGTTSVILAPTNLASHTHSVVDTGHTHGITDPGHHHTDTTVVSNITVGASAGGASIGGVTGNAVTGISVVASTTGITVANTGSGAPFSTLNPYAAINWMIKT